MSMEPTVLLALASATSQLSRSGGIVTTAADRLTVETPADLKPLVRGDLTVGVHSLEVAARSDRAAERKVALVEAAESFERAEDQDRLPRHLRGFAVGSSAGDRTAGGQAAGLIVSCSPPRARRRRPPGPRRSGGRPGRAARRST